MPPSGEERAASAARKAISSPLLESSIDGARGILLSIAGSSELGLLEVNDAAELVQDVAHPDANIIFGTVVDESMGDTVRVTVIAAGFDRFDGERGGTPTRRQPDSATSSSSDMPDPFEDRSEVDDEVDDDLDVPSFLK